MEAQRLVDRFVASLVVVVMIGAVGVGLFEVMKWLGVWHG
jgi:hypothetical protein